MHIDFKLVRPAKFDITVHMDEGSTVGVHNGELRQDPDRRCRYVASCQLRGEAQGKGVRAIYGSLTLHVEGQTPDHAIERLTSEIERLMPLNPDDEHAPE